MRPEGYGSRLTVFALATVAVCLGCSAEKTSSVEVPPGSPVVLISIDTLRSDHLPAYGYGPGDTPAIDGLRRDGILFLNAFSHVPFTLPSHASILTGLVPPEHGVRDNVGYSLDADTVPFLPRSFKELGYATGAAVSAYVLHGETGLGSGWDLYDDKVEVLSNRDLGGLQRRGPQTLEVAVDWLESVREQPFFLFFHIYEPHTPYEAPEALAARFASPYDAEVAAADAVIGELFEALERLGVYDSAVVILLSDHGEGLMDHGDAEHNLFVYREVLQVPLIMKLPGGQRAGSTVEEPVQLTDVAPTLLELMGVDPPAQLRGASLLRVADGTVADRRLYAENFYPRIQFGWSELASIVAWPFHLIYGPDPEIYNLQDDPGETVNLLDQERRTYGELKAELESYDRTLRRPEAVDDTTRDRLAALGYLGGTSGVEAKGPRPDPKSKLDAFGRLRQAFRAFGEEDYALAAEIFQRLTAEDPEMISAWRYLARSLRRLERNDEALVAFEEALRRSDGAPEVARGAADLLLDMGRLDEAKEHALLAVGTHKLAYELLAEIALRQDNLEEAAEYSDLAVENRGGHLSPLMTRAKLLVEQNHLEEALEVTQEVEEEFGDRQDRQALQGLFLTRGRAYAELGEEAAAVQAFQQEIEISPDSLAPYSHLALVFAITGQADEAGRTLQQMVETNPSPEAYAEAVRTLRLMGDERSASLVLRDARRRWPDAQELQELAG